MPITPFDLPLQLREYGYNYAFITEKLDLGSKDFKRLSGNSNVTNVTAETIGIGFSSKVYKIKFEFNNRCKWSFVMKVPSMDMLIETGLRDSLPDNICEMTHRTECGFLEIVKTFPNMPIPTVYYTEVATEGRAGCIMMQDLSETAVVIPLHVHVPEELCINIAKTVAQFQANAQRIPAEVFKTFEHPEYLFNTVEKMFKESLPGDATKEGVDEEKLEKVMFMVNIDFIRYAMIGVANEHHALGPVHGDLHGLNILMKKNEDNSMSNQIAAFIDWQGVNYGNPLADLARFMTNMVDSNVRRGLGDRIVDIYYDALIEELEKVGGVVTFSRATCQILYEITFVYHTLCTTIMPRFQRHLTEKAEPDQADTRVAIAVLRANHMLKDALPLIQQHKLEERFGVKD